MKAVAFQEASHYQGRLLVYGIIAAVVSGVFIWAQMGYNLVAIDWLMAQGPCAS